ncbi:MULTISPECIES: BTAD domain-containing putative transcriptional regulator [Kribbella]|uniref:AfsR/SARP family transcriptional regulator n=1 Tax=Kribbella TaxID=182639 RepID=UPI001305431D|nr:MULTISPECIES: BTAD domain-containing putative transcriptional regulator [Kribbella]
MLHLFGEPFVTIGHRRMEVPEGSKRLLVFVALHRCPVDRRHAAGELWPDCDDARASGNLRSALWRLNGTGMALLDADKFTLAIENQLVIDMDVVGEWAARLIDGCAVQADLAVKPWGADALELLPGWYDDWALLERERMRQRLLHALEAQSRQLVLAGRCAEAVEAAMVAVGADPLRESAQRVLIESHLAEGNQIEARRSYETYRRLLHREVGADPDGALACLVSPPVRPDSQRDAQLNGSDNRTRSTIDA